jgi:anti-sigma factor RsiW
MSDPTRHFDGEIQDLLDGRLDSAAEAGVRAHLEVCGACHEEFQRLAWLKRRLRALPLSTEAPADLEGMIRDALDAEASGRPTGAAAVDAASTRPVRPIPPRNARVAASWLTAAVAASLLLAIAGGLAAWWWLHAPRPTEVGRDYLAVAAGTLPVAHATNDPRALGRYYAARGGVPTGVYDLGMMQYTLVGGRVHAHRGQPGTLTLYEGANGERLICEMYFAPPPSRAPVARRTNNGIEFTVYRHEDTVMVFWDEGPVTCVLVARMEPDALLRIAFAKAGRRS